MKSVVSPFMATAFNIIILFIIYTLMRVEFIIENSGYFRQALSEGRLITLLAGGTVFDTPGIMYTNALYILLMLLPFHLKERPAYYKACKWIFIIINSLAIIADIADSVYFPFTLRRTSSEIFTEFANEGNLGAIFLKSALTHWYLVLFAAFLIWGLCRLYVSPAIDMNRQPKLRYYLVSSAGLAIGAVTCVSGIRGGLLNHWWQYLLALPAAYIAWRLLRGECGKSRRATGIALAVAAFMLVATAPIGGWRHRDIRPIAISNASAYTAHPTEAAVVLNTPFSIIRTIGGKVFSEPAYFASTGEAEKVFSPLHQAVADTVAHKNIVVIIIESFGREYIGGFNREVLGESYAGYTPFTDSLMRHSAVWRHSFANGRKSIDAMPSILAGIPMFVKPFILTPQALNSVKGIPAHLAAEGYSTAFFHGARTGSMGFDAFARSVGFNNYYGREDFNGDNRFGGDRDFDGYWAIWDEPFLQYYAMKMSEMKEPFMTAVFTASSHHPFNIPESYRERFKEEELPIHKCIRYTDNALRRFFDTARLQPWFANTIFVITSDHTNQSNHEEYKSDIGGFSAPLLIYDPSGGITPGMREGIAQQTDIMPTLLNAVGYAHPYIAYGIDLIGSPDDDTWAVNYLNGIYQYVSEGYVLQFDGNKSIGLYSITDYRMEHNLIGDVTLRSRTETLELRLKAIIQSYMNRMLDNRLT